jgi:DNA polymerase III delta subunit
VSGEPAITGILVAGAHDFFVEEAAEEIRAAFSFPDEDIERISEESLASRLPLALSTGSLFSSRRLVEADLTPIFGGASPAALWDDALAAWSKGTAAGRRESFRKARALLASVGVSASEPEAAAAALARRARRKEGIEDFAALLRELPPESESLAAVAEAVRDHLERGDAGTLLVARAVDPPRDSPLYRAFEKFGEVRVVGGSEKEQPALLVKRAKRLAADAGVELGADAVQRLLHHTDNDPRAFAGELAKLLEWAGKGARVTAADVDATTEDRSSEDVYALLDAVGSGRRAAAFQLLDRTLSGRALRGGARALAGTDPLRGLMAMLVNEIRNTLFVRSRCEELGIRMDPGLGFPAYQSRIHPRLSAKLEPFASSLISGHPFRWYKIYQRSCRLSAPKLEEALLLCVEMDAATKDSVPVADAIAAIAGRLLA